ncbi:uncharacterized protein LOC124857158 [Girardinichthys multiradiatus]|uniref:uncharacterized protein LOC124857158 n=1 Tax=Girardinichthys multiradiatus TaxID=208333 RepID=UPI001FAE59AA|nr:uncharacterized protein LOC124857158 [Girardinichthys multiradiatus]
MSLTTSPALVPDKDSLPLKKRDQRVSSPQQQQRQQLQCDATNFKAPYPYRSHSDLKTKHMGLFRPVPRRVTALYQPWMQIHAPPRPKQNIPSAFREPHGWAEWREFCPLPPVWDYSHQYPLQNHLSGTRSLQSGRPHYLSSFSDNPNSEGMHRGGGGWERLKTLKDRTFGTQRGPYARRGERRTDDLLRAGKGGTYLPHSTHEDTPLKQNSSFKSTKAISVSGQSLIRVSPDNVNGTCTSTTGDRPRSPVFPSSTHTSFSPTSHNHFPWLLPHFVAGSLIELRDGRLRRVENLQTEDFLLGSLACPDLRLSCCTVQSISPSASASSSSVSRLLILLHEQQSQELVDVYVEYPFFVRGEGWSSCSPQRTALLCGLQCRQLSVGDVCLALTPVSTPDPLLSDSLGPKTAPKKSEDRYDSLKANTALCSQAPPELKELTGEQRMETKVSRRRHYSAP